MNRRLRRLLAAAGLTTLAAGDAFTVEAAASLTPDQRLALAASIRTDAEELDPEHVVTDEGLADATALADALATLEAAATAAPVATVPRGPRAPRVSVPDAYRPQARPSGSAITAAGGRPIAQADLAEVLADTLEAAARGYVPGAGGRHLAATITAAGDLPRLGSDAHANTATMAELVASHVDALTASGGICGPSAPLYDVAGRVDASTLRPIADGLPRVTAERGSVVFQRPPTLAEVEGGVGVWTAALDANPGQSTKPIVDLTCGEDVEVDVAAVVRRLGVGNFAIRYSPEVVAGWLRTLEAAHARLAERTLLGLIDTGSVPVTAGQVLGTARDVMATMDRASAVLRDRLRLEDDAWMTFIAPRWLRDQIRVDVARQLPGDDTLGVTDARIAGWFTARRIQPIWSYDGTTGQTFAAQAAGGLQPWPSTVKTRLFPAGHWSFLDGGTLDLGVVRDSVLNPTNDAEVFAETFEAVARYGPAEASWTLTLDTCPDGSSSATVDINPCTTGS